MASRKKTTRKAGKRKRQPRAPVDMTRLSAPPPEVLVEESLFPEVTDPKKRAYIAQYAMTGNLGDAAACARISLKTGWNWRHDDKDTAFHGALAVAKGIACDRIEAEIRRRAIEGVDEPVFQGGRLVGTVRKFSDTLLIFMAKGAMPEKYRERFEHSGKDGAPIPVICYLPSNGREAQPSAR